MFTRLRLLTLSGLLLPVLALAETPPKPPVAWVVERAEVTVQLPVQAGDDPTIQLDYTFRRIGTTWLTLSFADGIVPRSTTGPLSRSSRGSYVTLDPAEDRVTITLSGVLPASGPASARLQLPAAPETVLHVENAGQDFTAAGSLPASGTDRLLPASGVLDLSWRPHQEAAVASASAIVRAETSTAAWVQDGALNLRSRIRFIVTRGAAERFEVDVSGLEEVEVEGPAAHTISGSTLVLTPANPVEGMLSVEITARRPVVQGVFPAPSPLNVTRTESWYTLGKPDEGDVVPSGGKGISARQLPTWARGLSESTPVAYWSSAPTLSAGSFETVMGPDTIVQSAEYVVTQSEDGHILARATWLVRNERSQYLEVTPPPGVRPLTARVSGRPALILREGDTFYVPLEKSIETVQGLLAFPVEVSWIGEADPWGGRHEERILQLPAVNAPIQATSWEVHLPRGWRVDKKDQPRSSGSGSGSGAILDAANEQAREAWTNAIESYKKNDFVDAARWLNASRGYAEQAVEADAATMDNVGRLQSNLDVLLPTADKPDADKGEDDVLSRRVRDLANAKTTDAQITQSKLEEEARKAILMGDDEAAASALEEVTRLAQEISVTEQKESNEQSDKMLLYTEQLNDSKAKLAKKSSAPTSSSLGGIGTKGSGVGGGGYGSGSGSSSSRAFAGDELDENDDGVVMDGDSDGRGDVGGEDATGLKTRGEEVRAMPADQTVEENERGSLSALGYMDEEPSKVAEDRRQEGQKSNDDGWAGAEPEPEMPKEEAGAPEAQGAYRESAPPQRGATKRKPAAMEADDDESEPAIAFGRDQPTSASTVPAGPMPASAPPPPPPEPPMPVQAPVVTATARPMVQPASPMPPPAPASRARPANEPVTSYDSEEVDAEPPDVPMSGKDAVADEGKEILLESTVSSGTVESGEFLEKIPTGRSYQDAVGQAAGVVGGTPLNETRGYLQNEPSWSPPPPRPPAPAKTFTFSGEVRAQVQKPETSILPAAPNATAGDVAARVLEIQSLRSFLDGQPTSRYSASSKFRLAGLYVAQANEDFTTALAAYHASILASLNGGAEPPADQPLRDYTLAAQMYSEIVALSPEFDHLADAYLQLARCLGRGDSIAYDPEGARTAYEALAAQFSGTTFANDANFALGEHWFGEVQHAKQLQTAIPYYMAVIADGPSGHNYGRAAYKLGWVEYKLDRYEPSLRWLTLVLNLPASDERAAAMRMLAIIYADRAFETSTRPVDLAMAHLAAVGHPAWEREVLEDLASRLMQRAEGPEAIAVWEHLQARWPQLAADYQDSIDEAHSDRPERSLAESARADSESKRADYESKQARIADKAKAKLAQRQQVSRTKANGSNGPDTRERRNALVVEASPLTPALPLDGALLTHSAALLDAGQIPTFTYTVSPDPSSDNFKE